MKRGEGEKDPQHYGYLPMKRNNISLAHKTKTFDYIFVSAYELWGDFSQNKEILSEKMYKKKNSIEINLVFQGASVYNKLKWKAIESFEVNQKYTRWYL